MRTQCFESAKAKLDEWFIYNQTPVLDDNIECSQCVITYYTQHAQYLSRQSTEQRNLKAWLDYFKTSKVHDIRPQKQRAFIHALVDQGYAKSTIEGIFKTGVSAITFAHKNEMLLNMPPIITMKEVLSKFKFSKAPRWRPVDMSETIALFNHATTPRLMRFLMVLIATGCRPSAALELTGAQINRKAGTIDLLTPDCEQTNKYRPTVRLPSFIEAIYHQGNICAQAQVKLHPDRPLDSIRTSWNTARRNAQLDQQVTPYSIRHSTAKWLRTCGVGAWHTSSQLGHRKTGSEITEIYATSDPKYLSEVVEAIEAYFAIIYENCPRIQEQEWLKNYTPRCGLVAKYKKFI